MRTLSLLALVTGCSWGGFDDLQNSMWVSSMEKPNVGSSDYATAIVGATSGTGGGRLAVTGNSVPTYSTLAYDMKGGVKLGPNPQKLGVHFIATLSDQPILVSDGAGKIALVAPGIDVGNIAVVVGDADSVADQPFPSTNPPTAAAFFGQALVIAAGSTLFVQDGGMVKACTATDGAAPVTISALERDDQMVWAWATTGQVFGYDGASLATTCTTSGTPPNLGATVLAGATQAPTGNPKIMISGTSTDAHQWAVVASDSAAGPMISVVDLRAHAVVGTGLGVEGMAATTLLDTGTATFVAIGLPRAMVGSVTTGQVELHALDTTTGALDATAAETLNDAQPDANQVFGRALTTMTFNDKSILVVAASNEVFAYYRTQLYADTR